MPLAPSLDTIGWFARDIELYDRVGAILLGDDAREFNLTKLLYMPVLEQLLLGEAETDAYRAMCLPKCARTSRASRRQASRRFQ